MDKIISIVFLLIFILVPAMISAGQVNSFIYHRFDDDRYPSTNISARIFEQQLKYLRDQKIPLVSTQDISERIAKNQPLPEHAVMVTVDDAYRSFYDSAIPLIKKYNVPVSLFVNTDSVGTAGYMSWDEIREVVAAGVEIGNHTASHAYLVEIEEGESFQQWQQRIRGDILRAQEAFERELGLRPDIFAYPYGEYSSDVIAVLEELGFIAAYAQQSGVIYGQHHPYTLPRFPMGGPFATFDDFKSKVAMKPLKVSQQAPFDSILKPGQPPPVLEVYLPEPVNRVAQLNCFVQGNNRCRAEANPEKGEGWYRVVADEPLSGRRNKYTLTQQSPGGGWLWFSQLWINAEHPAQNK